jgi:hypothetical protein
MSTRPDWGSPLGVLEFDLEPSPWVKKFVKSSQIPDDEPIVEAPGGQEPSSSDDEVPGRVAAAVEPKTSSPAAAVKPKAASPDEENIDLESADPTTEEIADILKNLKPPGVSDNVSACAAGDACSCTQFGDRLYEAGKAGVLQMVATALTFGIKPWVEAAITALALGANVPAAVVAVLSALAGGVFVGVVHQLGSNFAKALLNGTFQLPTYGPPKDATELNKQLKELFAIALPVFVCFCGTFASKDSILESVKNEGAAGIAEVAFGKTCASVVAGLFQGIMTNAFQQLLHHYKGYVKTDYVPQNFFERMAANLQAVTNMETGRKTGHDLVGKIIGGVVGGALAGAIKPEMFFRVNEEGGAEKGGAAMAVFLTGWFVGIHGCAISGNLMDLGVNWLKKKGAGKPEPETDPTDVVIDIDDNVGVPLDSSLPSIHDEDDSLGDGDGDGKPKVTRLPDATIIEFPEDDGFVPLEENA